MTAKKNSTKKKTTKNQKEKTVSIKEQLLIEKDKNLRLFAEFDNFRKRTAKERIELFSTASQDIMTSLLPILDNFERSFKVNQPKEDDGILLIYNQFKAELEKKGLKEIENPIGKTLDTDFHEAITNIPTENEEDRGKIVDVIEKGYLLSSKVLRYTKVVVAN
ncbi:MAG: nucleotide exchange factor GrpE [Flavobacteriales bacterium]|nr:nucleotide exchange factor GrpE [Flavobacteriales bacterium]